MLRSQEAHRITPLPRRTRLQAPRRAASPEARLGLVEFLLGSDDPRACAEEALHFLLDHGRIRQALCTAMDREGKRLVGLAGVGFSSHEVEEFQVELEITPRLAEMLDAREPRYFPRGSKLAIVPFKKSAFHVLPLLAARRVGPAAGLLLVEAASLEVSADARWAAGALGEKLHRLRWRQSVVEGGFERERVLLYNIIDGVTDPILLTDPEGRLIIANARAEVLFAARDDHSEGRRRAVALNNMLFSSAVSSHLVSQSQPGGLPVPRYELSLVDPVDGSDLLFELLSFAIRDPQGGSSVVSILRNVTDLGRAAAEIRESYLKLKSAEAGVRAERHRLELIIDSVVDPIVVTDASGDIVLTNEPAERLFTPAATAGEDAQRWVRANDAHFSSFVSNLLFAGSGQRYQGEVNLADPQTGEGVPFEAVAGKVLSQQGELTWVVTILHDRTEALEKARLYEELRRASEELEAKVQAATAELADQNELLRRQAIELEQASALKTQFLANISHELRTPLNAVLGYTSMLMQGVSGGLTDPQKRSLSRVDSNARHLLALINDILDITRIEAGRMPLHLSTFGVGDLISEVMAELEPIIARSRLKVETELAQRLPQVKSDRKKVKQIVLNLLSNALKFTHKGAVTLIATHDRRKDLCSVSVADTGIGIALHDQTKIFEDFRQLDSSSTRAYGGTGLGLSICRRLATMLHGQILLRSEPGTGSTFTFHFPRRMPKR